MQDDVEYSMQMFTLIEILVMGYKAADFEEDVVFDRFESLVKARRGYIDDDAVLAYDQANMRATFNMLWGEKNG